MGHNLHDHPLPDARWRATIPTINKMRIGTAVKGLVDYVRNGSGLLAMTMVQVQCMGRTDPGLEGDSRPAVQIRPFAITRAVDENGMYEHPAAKEQGLLSSSTSSQRRAVRVALRATRRRTRCPASPTSSWPIPTTCATVCAGCVQCST